MIALPGLEIRLLWTLRGHGPCCLRSDRQGKMNNNRRSRRTLCSTFFGQPATVQSWCAPNGSRMDIKGAFPKVALYGGSRFSLPLSHERFVMCLLATGLRGLNFFVLPLETTCVLLDCHSLFDKILRSILFVDPRAIPFCRPLDHGTNL